MVLLYTLLSAWPPKQWHTEISFSLFGRGYLGTRMDHTIDPRCQPGKAWQPIPSQASGAEGPGWHRGAGIPAQHTATHPMLHPSLQGLHATWHPRLTLPAQSTHRATGTGSGGQGWFCHCSSGPLNEAPDLENLEGEWEVKCPAPGLWFGRVLWMFPKGCVGGVTPIYHTAPQHRIQLGTPYRSADTLS